MTYNLPSVYVAVFQVIDTNMSASMLLNKTRGFCAVRLRRVTVKVKQSLLQLWTGPNGSRSLSLQDFKTICT